VTEGYVERNRDTWDGWAAGFAERDRARWATDEPRWGTWGVPERDLHLLADVEDLDAVELGCGTAYVSAWLARRGARPVGLDNSPNQLASARRFQNELGPRFPLVHGDAEHAPFADASFDLAISEYGAAIWCDPYAWIPEAARILRPGGRLVFLGHSVLAMLCSPLGDEVLPVEAELIRPHHGMHRFDWSDATEFQIAHGEMIRLLRSSGFEVEDLLELQAPEDGTTTVDWVTLEWARRFPTDEVWKARKL